jgi:hypothetical protein
MSQQFEILFQWKFHWDKAEKSGFQMMDSADFKVLIWLGYKQSKVKIVFDAFTVLLIQNYCLSNYFSILSQFYFNL